MSYGFINTILDRLPIHGIIDPDTIVVFYIAKGSRPVDRDIYVLLESSSVVNQ